MRGRTGYYFGQVLRMHRRTGRTVRSLLITRPSAWRWHQYPYLFYSTQGPRKLSLRTCYHQLASNLVEGIMMTAGG